MDSQPLVKHVLPLMLSAAITGGCVPLAGVAPTTKPVPLTRGTGPLKSGTPGLPGTSGTPGTPGTPGKTGTPLTPATGLSPAQGGGLITDAGGGLITDAGGGLITDAGGGLITDAGGGIISTNAGNLVGAARVPASLIGNNGSAYRVLAAPQQVPLANAQVRVLDAAGQAVLDAAGQPLVTTTNAEGHYVLKVPEPVRHMVVSIALPGTAGTLTAIAPREKIGLKAVNTDLYSTLTTSYVLSQYVRGQGDPGAALDKLPAEIELETRVKAASAFEKAGATVPASLKEAEVVSAVEKLKQADTTFGEQMEKVRKLLVVAGLSDLGSGKLGTEVALSAIRNLAVADDGTLYINCGSAHRVWRLASDGRLYTAAGSGTPANTGTLDGLKAAEAGISDPLGVSLDSSGLPLIVEGGARRVSRITADGRLVALAPGLTKIPRAAMIGADGRLHVVTVDGDVAEYWSAAAGETLARRHGFSATDSAALKSISTYGLDAQGRLCFSTGDRAAYRFDPNTLTMTAVAAASGASVVRATFDTRGNLFVYEKLTSGGRLRVLLPDGTERLLLDQQSALFQLGVGAALAPNGDVYMNNWGNVNRLRDGKLTGLAGGGTATAATLDELSLTGPAGLAFLSGGELVVADSYLSSKVWKVNADRSVTRLVGGGPNDRSKDGLPGVEMGLAFVGRACTDAAGNLYILESSMTEQTVRRLDTAGKLDTIFRTTTGEQLRDMVVAQDGTLYLSMTHTDETLASKPIKPEKTVMRKRPGESTPTVLFKETLPHTPNYFTLISLALDAQGGLYVSMNQDGKGRLKRWTESGGLKLVKEHEVFKGLWNADNVSLAVDGQGRVYICRGLEHMIHRYDPDLDVLTAIAGAGTSRFGGTGVEASLQAPKYPAFNAAGDLYFSDTGHLQIKRIPAADLP